LKEKEVSKREASALKENEAISSHESERTRNPWMTVAVLALFFGFALAETLPELNRRAMMFSFLAALPRRLLTGHVHTDVVEEFRTLVIENAVLFGIAGGILGVRIRRWRHVLLVGLILAVLLACDYYLLSSTFNVFVPRGGIE
jgi:hypothetical protein